MYQVLFVDEDPRMVGMLSNLLGSDQYDILDANSFDLGRAALEQQRFELLLVDTELEGGRGTELVRYCRETHPETVVLVLGSEPDVETTVELMLLGAYDLVVKPIRPNEFLQTVQHALGSGRYIRGGQDIVVPAYSFTMGELIAESTAMLQLTDLIRQLAPSTRPVSLVGEKGSGKTAVAKALHLESGRSGELITVDGRELELEDFLPGAKKGFLGIGGSTQSNLLAQLDQATLYVTHADQLASEVQHALYNLLDGRPPEGIEVEEPTPQVRLVTGSRKDLELQVDVGLLDPALFARLSPFTIELPSINQRGGDLLALCHLMAGEMKQFDPDQFRLEPEAARILEQFPWSGGMAELQKVATEILRAADGEVITIDHLPDEMVATTVVEAEVQLDDRDPHRHMHAKALLRDYQEQAFAYFNHSELPNFSI